MTINSRQEERHNISFRSTSTLSLYKMKIWLHEGEGKENIVIIFLS